MDRPPRAGDHAVAAVADVSMDGIAFLIPAFNSRRKTSLGEFVGVAITRADLDPMVFDRLIQSSLEIGIPHIHEMIAAKYSAREDPMLHENAKDLAPDFVIR
jgi:hypothetical protein